MQDRELTLTLDDGSEVLCDILFTYHDEERDKNYVVFQIRENGDISAAAYDENDDQSGSLQKIETDEEWEMLEELLDEYSNQNEPQGGCSGCSKGSCAGCSGCDDLDDEEL